MGGYERAREPVDTGRDRGVGRENRSGPNGLPGLVKTELVGLEEFPDTLYTEESRVALVGVKDLRSGIPVAAQYARIARTPPMPSSSSCSSRCSAPPPYSRSVTCAGGRVVLLYVTVEEEERHPPDLGDEDLRVQRPAFGERQRDPRWAVGEVLTA